MAILPKFFNETTMQIQRNFYLQQLIDGRQNGLIKIITGIRRCGKSYLLFTLFYQYLKANGIANTMVYWPSEEGKEPQALTLLHEKKIDMVVNIPKDLTTHELTNGYKIRRAAIDLNVPLITNSRLASAFITAFCTLKPSDIDIKAWGEY